VTPPDDIPSGQTADAPGASAVSARLEVLKKRADFLRAARAQYKPGPAFVLQARQRRPDEPGGAIRVGFTCSKKVGNAVARNRAKRRLREMARRVLPEAGCAGWDYVLIGRRHDTAARDFALMQDDLRRALRQIHR
jgi:ribonuclease P protein component